MANFDYDYNNNDFQIINDGNVSGIQLSAGDYIRISVYEDESTDILEYSTNNISKKAIFYSSLDSDTFLINTSPSDGGVEPTFKALGGIFGTNDFKIYERTNNESGLKDYYLKPNELFDREEIPDGNYTIQVDFLRQLAPTSLSQSTLESLPFPIYYQQFDVNKDADLNTSDSVEWDSYGRPDIAVFVGQHILDPNAYPINPGENLTPDQESS